MKSRVKKKIIPEINETKSWFFENISEIDKPLARLITKEREWFQINKIRMINLRLITEIQRPIEDYCAC